MTKMVLVPVSNKSWIKSVIIDYNNVHAILEFD